MTRWAWPGILSLEIPEGWRVDQADELIEVTPPDRSGAAHITVLRRSRVGPVTEGEAQELAENFSRRQGVDAPAGSEFLVAGSRVSQMRFDSSNGDRMLHWEVEAHVWPDRALICTYCGEIRPDPSRDRALAMFATISRDRGGHDPAAAVRIDRGGEARK